MVKIPEDILIIVQDYIRALKREIPVDKVVLFGSYAKECSREDSDIDLAVFSDYFEGMRRVDAIYYLLFKAADYDIDLQPLPFAKSDYYEQTGFAKEVLEDGFEIDVL